MTLFTTRTEIASDLAALGVLDGDIIMVHSALSKLGPVLGGPDAVIGALCDAVGSEGTVSAYTDWDAGYESLADEAGRVPLSWRMHVPPFHASTSRAVRDHGVLPEFLRTTPGALRSGNPGASVTALGARAKRMTRDHPLDYGYGPGSPFAKLVEAGGKVLMLGAPLDTMTLIHHAEHLADLPNKRIKRMEVPLWTPSGVVWRLSEEFDTGTWLTPRLDNRDYFTEIAEGYLAQGMGKRGQVGSAPCVLVDAPSLVEYAVAWLEANG